MRFDKALLLTFYSMLVIGLIFMLNKAPSVGILIWALDIPIGLFQMKARTTFILRHDIIKLSKMYNAKDILNTIEGVLLQAKWSSAVGPGQINMRQSKLMGTVLGPVLSASLLENYNNVYELDLWISNYDITRKGVVKVGETYPKMKEKIIQAVLKYAA